MVKGFGKILSKTLHNQQQIKFYKIKSNVSSQAG